MTRAAYVILAAGRGSRMGRVGTGLHKALLPLSRRAILTHLIDLAPPGAEIIICTGHLAGQVRAYTEIAHPGVSVTWVPVAGWDQPGSGPGASLLAAREAVGERDLIVTSCDTLWEHQPIMWDGEQSWAAYAPMPAGTHPERWCRLIITPAGRVTEVIDKNAARPDVTSVYTGLARIARDDVPEFWRGVEGTALVGGELQVSGGLRALARGERLSSHRITWTDTGDEHAYRRAVIARDGYDWSKTREATWVLPSVKRVVKWWDDSGETARKMSERAARLTPAECAGGIPPVLGTDGQFLTLEYIPGISGYDAVKSPADVSWLMHSPVITSISTREARDMGTACWAFYSRKTVDRMSKLDPALIEIAHSVMQQVTWPAVLSNPVVSRWHGDLNLGNVIFDGRWWLIDWRSDFDGHAYGDWRHDLGKLIAGFRVRWDWAQHGDFTPWEEGRALERALRAAVPIPPGTDEIGILSLLSSAPLHEPPLDEVLVARAAQWAEEIA